MRDAWDSLPVNVQDGLVALVWALPLLVVGALLLRGLAPWPLVRALLVRFRVPVALFVLLIAVSVGTGISLVALERGLRAGTARAADQFDLIVAAPGSDITALMATVFLQPSDMPLLDGATWAEVTGHPAVSFAAPLAFGDSAGGAPVVGTTANFLDHLAEGAIEGRVWTAHEEAVVGADTPFAIGDALHPAHGVGDFADTEAHGDHEYRVVGRMARTGSPWDRAVLVPIETVWEAHDLPIGHAPARAEQIGPPFDAALFPGTPAILLRGHTLADTYGLRSAFQGTEETMAFFPGTVLSRLYDVLGDMRQIVSVLTLVTQVLVAAAVLTGFALLTRLIRRQMALLRALGAPARFVVAVVWSLAVTLMASGAALGVVLAIGLVAALASIVGARAGLAVDVSLGLPDVTLALAFVSLASLIALLPALSMRRQDIVAGLRG